MSEEKPKHEHAADLADKVLGLAIERLAEDTKKTRDDAAKFKKEIDDMVSKDTERRAKREYDARVDAFRKKFMKSHQGQNAEELINTLPSYSPSTVKRRKENLENIKIDRGLLDTSTPEGQEKAKHLDDRIKYLDARAALERLAEDDRLDRTDPIAYFNRVNDTYQQLAKRISENGEEIDRINKLLLGQFKDVERHDYKAIETPEDLQKFYESVNLRKKHRNLRHDGREQAKLKTRLKDLKSDQEKMREMLGKLKKVVGLAKLNADMHKLQLELNEQYNSNGVKLYRALELFNAAETHDAKEKYGKMIMELESQKVGDEDVYKSLERIRELERLKADLARDIRTFKLQNRLI